MPVGSQAQEQAEEEGGSGDAVAATGGGGTSDEWWDEHAAPPPHKAVRKIKNHHIYTFGARAGSLARLTGAGGLTPRRR